jgi:gliding motility-associated-like protein
VEYKEDIEQLFKDSFENFESDVHPDAWANIQHSLSVQYISNTAGSNGASVGTKAIVAGSKFGASYIIGVVAIVSLTAGIIYFSSKENTPVKTEKPVAVSNENSSPQIVSPSALTANETVKKEQIKAEEKGSKELKKSEIPVSGNKKEIESAEANNSVAKNSDKQSQQPSSFSKQDVTAGNQASESKPSITDQSQIKQPSTTPADTKIADINSENEPGENSEVSTAIKENKNTTAEKPDEYFLGIIPDVITPNADGKNDAFVIDGKELKSLQVSIHDRSGKIIHQWNNLHGFWDGRLGNGQPAEAGTYFYDIFATTENGKIITRKNSLTLIK